MVHAAQNSPGLVIGVLTPRSGGFYYGTVVNAILKVARRHNAVVIAFETSRLQLLRGGQVLAGARVDGWLAVNEFEDLELLAVLRTRPEPIVHVHSKPDVAGGSVVLPDNEGGTRHLTEHLIEHGHRSIAFAGNMGHVDIAERCFGFAAALEAAGIPLDDSLIFDTPHHKEADGRNVARELLARRAGSVTALVAGTDRLALGAMQALQDAGIEVPDDFAIVGFDDADAAQFAEPPLTTVRQSFAEIAESGVTELLAAIRQGRAPESELRVPTQPILRRSCGCLVSHSKPPTVLGAKAGRVAALTQELLLQAGRNRLGGVTLEEWPGAEKIARAVEVSVEGGGAGEVIRADWWAGFLRHQRDAESAVRVMALLEATFASWIASQTARPPGQGILRDLRVALMHQWQRAERLKVAHYESVTEASYRLTSELSSFGVDPSENLSWIRWSNAQHACCALWEESPAPGRAPVLCITAEYTPEAGSSMRPKAVVPVAPEEFPPAAMLETAQREGAIVSIASVPRSRGGEFGILAVVAPLAFEHLEYVGTPSDWAVQLGAALDRTRAERELRASAELDALTGLANRTTLLRRIDALRNAEDAPAFALLFVDLDDFKKVNDSLGHEAGDQLLVQMAARLTAQVAARTPLDAPHESVVARVGGDEFVIVLAGIHEESQAISVVEGLQDELKKPYTLQERTVFVSVSIGVNFGRGVESGAQELLRDADTAMYRAKMRGRALHEVFHLGMHAQAVEKLHLDSRLRLALEQDELELWYQPIVGLPGLADVGAEALVRWRHPEQGLLPPGRFLPIAEDVGLAIPISEWVIRRACAEAARFQVNRSSPLYVNVNVPAAHIKQPGFVEFVQRALSDSGLDPRAFGIEIVESTILDEPAKSNLALTKLLAMGVRIAIDDFGTGYSSLSYLRDFPVSTLKIDRSFVKNLPENVRDSGIARAIIAMGQGLGLGIVAEGIETAEQLQFLIRAGCDYGQGYFLSVPLEFDAFMARLAEQSAQNSRFPPRRSEYPVSRSSPPSESFRSAE